ncbi:MAG: ATP-dependent DNA helicase RecG [Prevotellaceae bacterium]|jgi:ATP-dependent DNA helicase RecG|nr:ATP-dependent DNA helicase RecG [Prevotellaceae bacterium]
MASEALKTDIKFLQGVGSKRAALLYKELNIATFGDMLYTFPYRYIDRTRFYTVSEINADLPYIQLKGKIVRTNVVSGAKQQKRLVLTFADNTGEIELVFFQGLKWIQEKYRMGIEYIVFGKPALYNGEVNLVHPEIELLEEDKGGISITIQGMYSSTEALRNNYIGNKAFVKLMVNLLTALQGKITETLPDYILNQYKLLPLPEALLNIHFPKNSGLLQKAYRRLKFEELFFIQLNVLRQRSERWEKKNGFVFSKVGNYFNTFYINNLPFDLTNAQKRVIREIRRDMGSGKQMNHLLQGDVGSGKTLVALLCMLIAADNGFQSCIMAPTEILATQHYESIIAFLKGMDINVGLLTGSTKKSERKRLVESLLDGNVNILIGTHALIEDMVRFKNLGFVVIDEQHRFGVEQRAKLWTKSDQPPHVLVMTATPIPRTLAMTLYGDLDVSIIDELPPGRKPIQTLWFNDSKRLRVFAFMKEQIKQGRQIYMVYPLIKESEKMDYKDLEDGYESITRAFPPPEYVTTVVHGKMKAADKDFSMKLFATGKAHIMVATSVIEVGVNVQNASVMVIESAERFGLAQLHQLRGRVGRGADQSYCILMSGYKLSNESKKRLELMVQTTDGFEIAEADLKLRGPGDLEGTQQSGLPINLRLTDLGKDGKLLEYVRNIAQTILDDDPLLNREKNLLLRMQLEEAQKKINDFREIG